MLVDAGKRENQLNPVAVFDLIYVIYILPINFSHGQPMSKCLR